MMDEHLDDAGGAVKAGAGADEDELGASPHEPVDQVLGEPVVTIRSTASRRSLAPVAARVVDIGVEPVLVRGVAGAAELRPEVAAVRA